MSLSDFQGGPWIQIMIGVVLIGFFSFIYIKNKKASGLGSPSKMIMKSGKTPILNTYTVDFTEQARIGKIDPVIGRTEEIIRLAQILSRREKNNAILVGDPGVGKTAIVEALAQRIAMGDVPEVLRGKRVLALEVVTLLSGTKYRGEFENRAKQLLKEIEACNRSIILFIDEMHAIIQSQGTEGAVNLSDILKPALARGDIQMIGATTTDEYRKYIKTDPALERRFQPVVVDEPSPEDTMGILHGVKEKYQEYHKVVFTNAALETAVYLTREKIKLRTLPDKAIDAIDEAASLVRVSHVSETITGVLYEAAAQKDPELRKTWKEVQSLDERMLKEKNAKKKAVLMKQRETLEDGLMKRGVITVDASDVEKVVNEWIHDV